MLTQILHKVKVYKAIKRSALYNHAQGLGTDGRTLEPQPHVCTKAINTNWETY